jgi:hypothetical protein
MASALLTWLGYFLVAYLQRGNEQTKYFREKLIDRYSEFVAVAVADLERAKAQASGMALGGRDQDYSEMAKLDERRHAIRLDLLRLALQIRMLEQDAALGDKVQELAKAQPFMAFPFPPRWGEGTYNERFEKFQSEIGVFEKQLLELTDAVVAKGSTRAKKVRLNKMPHKVRAAA